MKKLLLLLGTTLLLYSCQPSYKPFKVSHITFFDNLQIPADSVIRLDMDLSNAVLNGIEVPTKIQTGNGYFNFSFRIKNTSDRLQHFFYKLYYQNATYKFNEDHPYANENFYGSWHEEGVTFKATRALAPGEEVMIRDSFKIVGNPRNEKRFFGAAPEKKIINPAVINNTIQYIKTIPDWVKQIKEKARTNKVSVDEQFYIDALWSLTDQFQRDSSVNNRWKRNPRVGQYEFMLVFASQDGLNNLPDYFRDLSIPRGKEFINPFVYVRENALNSVAHTRVVRSGTRLQVRAKLDLTKGIYVNPLAVNKPNFTREFFNTGCNDSAHLYAQAHLELFFHNINRDYVLHNVKETRDVVGENLTRGQYNEYATHYKDAGKLIDTYVNATECPCRNVGVNVADSSVELRNPGNKPGEYRKEHVGLISRLGMTYGKYRAKIKFPAILSKDHVWNGITNAFWLMAQDVNLNWNMRRTCDAGIGYIPKQEADEETSLYRSKRQISYSEIDFEILKESEFWPKTSYLVSNEKYQVDDCANNHDIMVTCTNWDMACHQPEFFNIGAVAHAIDGVKYIHHRWNHWYKALTTKVRADHDELFAAPYYYYEIEWSPEKIIWRIGPEKDKLRIICVMDKNVTAVPNNQMLMIITQEWHNQEWWPTAPYKQNNIPFPKNDIVGRVLELEIE